MGSEGLARWKGKLIIALMTWPFVTAALITAAMLAGLIHGLSAGRLALFAGAGFVAALGVGHLFCR